jgi:hypothetical protein
MVSVFLVRRLKIARSEISKALVRTPQELGRAIFDI